MTREDGERGTETERRAIETEKMEKGAEGSDSVCQTESERRNGETERKDGKRETAAVYVQRLHETDRRRREPGLCAAERETWLRSNSK